VVGGDRTGEQDAQQQDGRQGQHTRSSWGHEVFSFCQSPATLGRVEIWANGAVILQEVRNSSNRAASEKRSGFDQSAPPGLIPYLATTQAWLPPLSLVATTPGGLGAAIELEQPIFYQE
jgi:hypothetical protein